MGNVQRMTRKKLGEILLQAGVIDDLELQAALTEQAKTHELLGEILVRRGFASETEIVKTLACQFPVAYLRADQIDLSPRVASLLPADLMRKHRVVPLDVFGGCLTVLMAGMLDAEVLSQIERQTGCDVQVFVGTASDVDELIDRMAVMAAEAAEAARKQDHPVPAETRPAP